MPIACKHFFTFLFTFSIMHNLGHLYLCIFKRQPSVRERWAIRIPLPQSGVKPFKSVKNRSRCPSAHPSPVRLRFRRPGARCRDHFFLHCSIPATENPMLRAFCQFLHANFFCTQKSDRKHKMCFPAGSVLFRFSIFCFFIKTLLCLKNRPDQPVP